MSSTLSLSKLHRRPETSTKTQQKHQKLHQTRFDGLTEVQLQEFSLPDYLQPNLDLIFIGINPSLTSAHRNKYYAGPGNHFYKLLHFSGFTATILSPEEDYKLLNYGIGLTNIVSRPTRSSGDLKLSEIKAGVSTIVEKILFYRPKVAVFNGKCIYRVFSTDQGDEFKFGLQLNSIGDSRVWVVPSTSARCANFPRMIDKLHFFKGLQRFLQRLDSGGEFGEVNLEEFRFEGKCRQFLAQTSKMWRRKEASKFLSGGRIANKRTVGGESFDEDVATVCCKEFLVSKRETLDNSGNIKKSLAKVENTEKTLNSDEKLDEDRLSLDNCADLGESLDNGERFESLQTLETCKDTESLGNNENSPCFESFGERKIVENLDSRVNVEEALDNCGNIGQGLDSDEKSKKTKNRRKTLDDYGKIGKFRVEKSISIEMNRKTGENFEFVDLIRRRLLERQENVEISCNLQLKKEKKRS